MNRNDFTARKIERPMQWLRVFCLYRRAFPRSERKPFRMIRSMWRRGKTDVWCFEQAGRFAGFAATINGSSLILLDYLAVQEDMRGRGIGSHALDHLKESYRDRGLFVEIENAFAAGPDQPERMRRRGFYLNNGMRPSRVMARVFDVEMELLCWNCCVDFPAYHAFYRDHYNAWAAEHILAAAYSDAPEDVC